MLLKWFTHEFCSSRLESRSRAVRSEIMAIEAERKGVDERIRQEGKQLQRNLEDLLAQRHADLQETMEFMNRYLASSQDMVQALQKYTEQIYATVDVWLKSRMYREAFNSAEERVKLLKEQSDFLREAKEFYNVFYDKSQRREWHEAQPKSALVTNLYVQSCADGLWRRRKDVDEHNQNIRGLLYRIESQQNRVKAERTKALFDARNARSKAETHEESHRKQRILLKNDWSHLHALWRELKDQINSRHPNGLYNLYKSFLRHQKRRETLHLQFREAQEVFSLAKEAVNRAWQEEDFDNLQSMKDARSRTHEERQNALEKWRDCSDQCEQIRSILKDKEFFNLREYWRRLNPYEHIERIHSHIDALLQTSERRIQAIGSLATRPSNLTS